MGARSEQLEGFGDDLSWALLDAIPDATIIANGKGVVVFANSQVEALFGAAPGELIDHPVEALMPRNVREAHTAHRTDYGADPRVRSMGAGLALRALRADGREIPVEISLSPLRLNGAVFTVAAIRDISSRLQSEERLRRSSEALREAEQVLAVAEDRERIARDLHDTVIQRLFGAGLQLQSTMSMVDERAQARLGSTIDDLDQTIKDLRTAIFTLQGASSSVPGGLRGRLLQVLVDVGPAMGFEPRLEFNGPVETIDDEIARQLVPVLREALSNVARHARARNVRVVVSVAEEVTLSVIDDGVGVPEEVLGGYGVTNMSERAGALGGQFELQRRPEGGTLLTWTAPGSATSSAGL